MNRMGDTVSIEGIPHVFDGEEWRKQDAPGKPVQLSILDAANLTRRKKSNAEAAQEWIGLNPEAFERMERYAADLVEKGHRRISVKMIFEVFRYFRMLDTVDTDPRYRLNNNWTAHFARKMASRNAMLADAFEFRG